MSNKNKSFPIGDTVRLTIYVRVDDVLTAATTCVVTIEEPDGTNNAPTVSTATTGVYTTTYVPDQAGYHRFKVVTTGNAAGIREGTFYVHSSGIV